MAMDDHGPYCDGSHGDPDDLPDDELHALVVKNFLALFTDVDFCVSIAPRMSCDEADSIASMIAIHGGREAARLWLECHADGDYDPDDEHHIPEIPDDVSGAEG